MHWLGHLWIPCGCFVYFGYHVLKQCSVWACPFIVSMTSPDAAFNWGFIFGHPIFFYPTEVVFGHHTPD